MATQGRYEHKMDVGEEGIVCSWPGGTQTIPWTQCLKSDGTAPKGLDELTQDQRYHITSDMIKDGSNTKLFRELFRRAWPGPELQGSLNKDFLDMSKNNSLKVHADKLTTIEWNASGSASTVPPHIIGITRDCGISSNTIAPWAFPITSFATKFDTATKSSGKVWPPPNETIILTPELFLAFGYPNGMYLKATTVSNNEWNFELTLFERTFSGKTDGPDFLELQKFTQGNDKNKKWFKQNPFKKNDERIDALTESWTSFHPKTPAFKDYSRYETNALLIIILKSLGDRLQCLFHLLNWVEHRYHNKTILMNTCDGPVFTVSLQFGPNTALLYDKIGPSGNRSHRCLLLDYNKTPCETCRKKNLIKISECIDSNRSFIRLYSDIITTKKYYVSYTGQIFEFNDTPATQLFFEVILRDLMYCNEQLIGVVFLLKSETIKKNGIGIDRLLETPNNTEAQKLSLEYMDMLNTVTNQYITDFTFISFFRLTKHEIVNMTKLNLSNNMKLTLGNTSDTLNFELYNELLKYYGKSTLHKYEYNLINRTNRSILYVMNYFKIIHKVEDVTMGWTKDTTAEYSSKTGGTTGHLYSSRYQTGGFTDNQLVKLSNDYLTYEPNPYASNITTSLQTIIPLEDILLEYINDSGKFDIVKKQILAQNTEVPLVQPFKQSYNLFKTRREIINQSKKNDMNTNADISTRTYNAWSSEVNNLIVMEEPKLDEVESFITSIEGNLERIEKGISSEIEKGISSEMDISDLYSDYNTLNRNVEENEAFIEVFNYKSTLNNAIEYLNIFSKISESIIKYRDAERNKTILDESQVVLSRLSDINARVEMLSTKKITALNRLDIIRSNLDTRAVSASGDASEATEAVAETGDAVEAVDLPRQWVDNTPAAEAAEAAEAAVGEFLDNYNNDGFETELGSMLDIRIELNLKQVLVYNLLKYITKIHDIRLEDEVIFDTLTHYIGITEQLSSVGLSPPVYDEIMMIKRPEDGYRNYLIELYRRSNTKYEEKFNKYMRNHVLPIIGNGVSNDVAFVESEVKRNLLLKKVVQVALKNGFEKKGLLNTDDSDKADDASEETELAGASEETVLDEVDYEDSQIYKSKDAFFTLGALNASIQDVDIDKLSEGDIDTLLHRSLSFNTVMVVFEGGGRSDKRYKRKYTKRGKMYKRKKYTKRGKMHKRKYTKRGKMHKRKYTKR